MTKIRITDGPLAGKLRATAGSLRQAGPVSVVNEVQAKKLGMESRIQSPQYSVWRVVFTAWASAGAQLQYGPAHSSIYGLAAWETIDTSGPSDWASSSVTPASGSWQGLGTPTNLVSGLVNGQPYLFAAQLPSYFEGTLPAPRSLPKRVRLGRYTDELSTWCVRGVKFLIQLDGQWYRIADATFGPLDATSPNTLTTYPPVLDA